MTILEIHQGRGNKAISVIHQACVDKKLVT